MRDAARNQDWPKGGLPHGEHPYDYGYGEATEVLPEGSVECWNCGAIIAWEGEPPTDCIRCGEAL